MNDEQTYVDDFFRGQEIPPEVEGLQGDTSGYIEDVVLPETGTLAEKQEEQTFIKEEPSITAKKVKGALQSAFPDLPKNHFSVAKQEAGEDEKVSYVIEVEDKPIDYTDTQADLANLKNGYTVKFSNGTQKQMPGFNANLYKDPEEQIRTLLAGKLTTEELAAIDVSKRKENNIVNQVRSKEPKRTEENEIEKISDEERFKEDYKASVLYELQQTTTISNFLQPSHSPKTQLTDEDKESIDKRLKAYEEKMGFNKVYELKMEALNELKEEPELSESMKKAISRVQKALTEQKENQTQVRTERKTMHQKKGNPFSLSR